MVKDEFRPDVGRKLFTQHQAELEQGLQQLAYALGSSQKLSRPAEFFQAFISGFWDPFQEACEAGNQQQKEITEKIRSLECQLRQGITPDMQNILGQYSDFLAARKKSGCALCCQCPAPPLSVCGRRPPPVPWVRAGRCSCPLC